MRPIDLAREHRLSAQAIRNYEDAGILPPSARSDTGYRRYTSLHAQALRTFLALRAGHGHEPAAEIMRAVNRGDTESAYRRLDATHLALLTERDTRLDVAAGLGALSTTPPPIPGPPLTVGELARRIGVHQATLRAWESAGILRPQRNRATGYREYGPDSVRDADIARQLRRGGYPLHKVVQFLDSVHEAGGPEALHEFLAAWQHRLDTRSRHLLSGAAQLDAYLTLLDRR
ncbi:MerR family transcriptional regulator [Nocardia cyriacigeorgica]|uniref:MerR family transcriptional regulator n=1 Tax=Nocardia cyriacigeorgica TaxID=135487 RepID=UPI0013D01566|nr:MerR family transcriptional regulator [Nocardia cyriacigeorgica]MBF6454537.1 MerR family transcriptional regulator [Nocardia cyriacigeorgica]MBF6478478.1 MerR family transcriptional regulator [Nocardia cyriacigeorgica]MBF6552431.1 MerR family transcriptional regulator [Nocardia cyriacigeorgica]NEW26070.1 MerR family transcriptional regulator [Nocardia cyriacigeorgica]